jgi:hypothetical protein
MQWRAHLPENCPPEDAVDAVGEFYRLISGTTPKAADFLSYRELYPDREFLVPECQAGGLSIYPTLEGISGLIRRIPALRKKKKLAKAVLEPELGKIKNTPSGNDPTHHTWWIPEQAEPWKVFHIENWPEDNES